MFTPAMTASSTSSPCVIIEKALCTQVRLPPFLNLFPLADEMTKGLTAAGISIVGTLLFAAREDATPTPTAALPIMKSRRFIWFYLASYSNKSFNLEIIFLCSARLLQPIDYRYLQHIP